MATSSGLYDSMMSKSKKAAHLKCYNLAFESLKIFKYGTESYIHAKMTELHSKMLNELTIDLSTREIEFRQCTSCDAQSFITDKACVVCTSIKIHIENVRVGGKQNIKWKHTNTKELSINHWEYAKVFMSKDYCLIKSAEETDLTGLLNIMILHTDLKHLNCNDHISKIKTFRNEVMHSGSFTCPPERLIKSIDIMIHLLKEHFSFDRKADWAKDRLSKIKMDGSHTDIAAEDDFEVDIDNILNDLLKTKKEYSASDKVALLVVNSDYKVQRPIHGARTSIVDFKKVLERLEFHVISLLNLTKKEYINALKMFNKLLRKGVYVLFYNNGHGHEQKGKLLLDVIEDKMEAENWVTLDEVMVYLKGNQPELNCIILDNCRSPGGLGWSCNAVQLPSSGNTIIFYATSGGLNAYGDNEKKTTRLLDHLLPRLQQQDNVECLIQQVRKDIDKLKYKEDQVPEIQTNIKQPDRSLSDPILDTEKASQLRKEDWINDVPATQDVVFPKAGVHIELSFQSNIANVLQIYSKVTNKGNTDTCSVEVEHAFAKKKENDEDAFYTKTCIQHLQKKVKLRIKLVLRYTLDGKNNKEIQTIDLGQPLVMKWNLSQ